MKYYKDIDEYSKKIYKDLYDAEIKIGNNGIFSNQFFNAYKETFNLDLSVLDTDVIKSYNIIINKILDKINISKNEIGWGIFFSVILYFGGSFIRDIWITLENVLYGSNYYIVIYVIWIIAFLAPTFVGISNNQKSSSIQEIISMYKDNASVVLNMKISEVKPKTLQDKLGEISRLYNDNIIDINEYEILRDKILNEL